MPPRVRSRRRPVGPRRGPRIPPPPRSRPQRPPGGGVMASRIAATVARLLGRKPRRAATVDQLGTVLAAASETGPALTVPGISAWLGRETAPDDSEFMASLAGGFTE